MANLRRMRHTWRISYLKVAHCTFLMTSHFCSPIFYYFFICTPPIFFSGKQNIWGRENLFLFFALHRHCQWKTERLRAYAHVGKPRCHAPPPPLCPCNQVLKPNFQPIISQTNNGCSLLSFILAKLLLLDISCQNIFALSVVPALTARPFSIKKVC